MITAKMYATCKNRKRLSIYECPLKSFKVQFSPISVRVYTKDPEVEHLTKLFKTNAIITKYPNFSIAYFVRHKIRLTNFLQSVRYCDVNLSGEITGNSCNYTLNRKRQCPKIKFVYVVRKKKC